MSAQQLQQQIAVSGSLFSISLFEEKLMKNFQLISNKLKKFQSLMDLQQKHKSLQKQFKFLTMKVDTILQKLPKDSLSINRNDVRLISKDIFFQLLNSQDDRLIRSKYHQAIITDLSRNKQQMLKGNSQRSNDALIGKMEKKDNIKTSFTAAQILREGERDKINKQVSSKTLKGVLSEKQIQLVSNIVDEKAQNSTKYKNQAEQQLRTRLDDLTKIVQQLRLGRGYASFLQKQAEKFERFQQFQQKSRQTTRKLKDKTIQMEGIKQENVRGEVLKNGLYTELQRMQLNKEQIARQQMMQKKTIYSNLSNRQKDQKEQKPQQGKQTKEKKKEKEQQTFKRSGSIMRLDRLERRLKVDDNRDLNSIFRQIELRIEGKVSHDIFMGFVKDIEEKIQMIRISNNSATQISELRKSIFAIQSKVTAIVAYLQSLQEDDALVVKKQWTCVSCDKSIQKFQGKIGQHLNWDSVSAKKMSPSKAGAFGQTGQLATKIRNLIEGNDTD